MNNMQIEAILHAMDLATAEVKRLREELKQVKNLTDSEALTISPSDMMKKLILSLEEAWNCPNDYLEDLTGITWMQYHELRRKLQGGEEE